MHDAMNNLVDDQAPVKVPLWQLGVGCVLDKRRNVRLSGDENSLLLDIEEPEDRSADGMADLAHDVHLEGPSQGNAAAPEQLQRVLGRGASEVAFLWRCHRDIDGRPRASVRTDEAGQLCRR